MMGADILATFLGLNYSPPMRESFEPGNNCVLAVAENMSSPLERAGPLRSNRFHLPQTPWYNPCAFVRV